MKQKIRNPIQARGHCACKIVQHEMQRHALHREWFPTTAVYDRRSARSLKHNVPEVKWCTAAPAVARPIAPVRDLRRIFAAIATLSYE